MLELNERVIPEAPVGAAGPAAGMDGVAVVADVVAGLEQQGDGILADRGGAVGRDVADGDTALPGAGDIHDVVARGQHADHFDVGAGLEDRPRQRRLVGQHDLGIRDARDRLRGICQARPVIDRHLRQLPQPIPAQIAGIFRITIQNHKFHVRLSFRQNPRRLPCTQLALILSQTGGFFCMNLIFLYGTHGEAWRTKRIGGITKKTTSGSCRRWFLSGTDFDAAAGGEGLAFEEQELFGEEAGEAAQDGGGGDHLRGVTDGKLHGDLAVKHGGGPSGGPGR